MYKLQEELESYKSALEKLSSIDRYDSDDNSDADNSDADNSDSDYSDADYNDADCSDNKSETLSTRMKL